MRFLFPTTLAFLLLASPVLHAQGDPELVEVGANDFRISDAGPDGNTAFGAFGPAIAYNPNASEYLVIWAAEEETDGEFEVYGQRLDAATGMEVGENDFRISTVGPDGDPDYDVGSFDVVYNPIDDAYLVVWEAVEPPEINASELYAQRLAADGTKIGTDSRISDAGPDGAMFFRTRNPAVVHNPMANEYLVVWSGDDGDTVEDLDTEIRGQRLDATGAEIGANDFRISDLGPDGNSNFYYGARNPSAVHNPLTDEYLVVWEGGDDDVPPSGTMEEEVYGQRLDATGAEIGANDFRISDLGPDGNTSYEVFSPDVTYNAARNEYLVVWTGEDFLGGSDTGDEVFGQLLDATGTEIGPNDLRISDMGPEGFLTPNAATPAVVAGEGVYVVVWNGDEADFPSGEYELYGQLVDAATGAEVGTNDVLLSDLDTDPGQGRVFNPTLARNTTDGEFLAAWNGERPAPEPAEMEIFGQRLAVEGLDPAVTVSAAPVNPPVVIPAGGGSFQFTVTLTNTTAEPQTFQAWGEASGPVDRNPVVGPRTVTLPAGATLTRTLTQRVPGIAPAGTYTYTVNVGTFGGAVTASDGFPLTKEGRALAHRDAAEAAWAVEGWDEAARASAVLPDGFALSEAHPNPFSGRSTLTLEVSEAQAVRAEVFDALGRRVAVLHDGAMEAGAHALVFDGSALPAGVYAVRVEGERRVDVRRVVLVR